MSTVPPKRGGGRTMVPKKPATISKPAAEPAPAVVTTTTTTAPVETPVPAKKPAAKKPAAPKAASKKAAGGRKKKEEVLPDDKSTSPPAAKIKHLLDDNGNNQLINAEIKKIKDKWGTRMHLEALEGKPAEKRTRRVVSTEPELDKDGNKKLDEKGQVVMKEVSKAVVYEPAEFEAAKKEHIIVAQDKDYNDAKKRLIALKSSKVRFSGGVPNRLGYLTEIIARELTKQATDKTKALGKKTVKNNITFDEQKLSCAPLISQLPLFRQHQEEYMRKEAEERLEREVNQTEKETRNTLIKDHGITRKKIAEKAAEKEAVKPVEKKEDEKKAAKAEEEEVAYDIKFQSHITKIIAQLKEEERYKGMKFSKAFQFFVSEVLTEFVNRVRMHIVSLIDLMKVKTVSVAMLKSIIQTMLTESSHYEETISLPTKDVIDVSSKQYDDEKAKKKANKGYKINKDAVPRTTAYEVKRTRTFQGSKFDAIWNEIEEKARIAHEKHQQSKSDA